MNRSTLFTTLITLVLVIMTGLLVSFVVWMMVTPRFSPPDPATSVQMMLRYCESTSQLPLTIGSRFSPGYFLACLQEYGYRVTK